MKTVSAVLALIALGGASGSGVLSGAELQPAAYSAWQAYLRTAEIRMQARVDGGGQFLWTDEAPERDTRLRSGEILVAPGMGNGVQPVPSGLIHHWIAAAFIPHADLAGVLRIAQDYGEYKQFYQPAILDSRLLARTGVEQSFSIRSLHRALMVTAVMDSEFVARAVQLDATRAYIVADTTRVQDVENYGKPDERVLPPDRGRGYVWRLHTVSRYEERNGGVYVEMETIALSREIPAAVRWLVSPVVARFSRSELMTSLRQTCEAVTANMRVAEGQKYTLAVNSAATRTGGGQR
jgi:hypothetical protein